MFKKILIYTGYTTLSALLCAYFFLSWRLNAEESSKLICREIKVTILDSTRNRFVSKDEVKELIISEGITPMESRLKHINHYELEEIINNKTAVKISQVSYSRKGILRVDVEQRRPILRLETESGGFYMDETAYIFPLIRSFTSYVPVVTGRVPLKLPAGFRGEANLSDRWTSSMYNMALYLESNSHWSSFIEQMHIDSSGVMFIVPRVGTTEVVFGDPENYLLKFQKLQAFYNKVVPAEGWDRYSKVDLRFSNQLVCKKREEKQIKT